MLVRAGIETGPLSVWLWGELKRRELPILCLDARHANAALKMMPNKTDRADARGLAQIVRTGWFRQAYVKSAESRLILGQQADTYQLSAIPNELLPPTPFATTRLRSVAIMRKPLPPRTSQTLELNDSDPWQPAAASSQHEQPAPSCSRH